MLSLIYSVQPVYTDLLYAIYKITDDNYVNHCDLAKICHGIQVALYSVISA
jgi:hypothetical protein